MTIKMRALKSMMFRNRRYAAGDTFHVSEERTARVYTKLRRAVVVKSTPELQTRAIEANPSGSGIEALRIEYHEITGEVPNIRWKEPRLRSELEAARAAAQRVPELPKLPELPAFDPYLSIDPERSETEE